MKKTGLAALLILFFGLPFCATAGAELKKNSPGQSPAVNTSATSSLQPQKADNAQTKIIFKEDFNSNNHHWPQVDDQDFFAATQKGRYVLENRMKDGTRFALVPVTFDPNQDFTIETTFNKKKGLDDTAFGLVWGAKDTSNFYLCSLAGRGYFRFAKMDQGQDIDIISWREALMLKPYNSINKLTIKKKNQHLLFYINDQLVDTVPFSPFMGNKIGFVVNQGLRIDVDEIVILRSDQNPTQMPMAGADFIGSEKIFEDEFEYNQHNWLESNSATIVARVADGHYNVQYKRGSSYLYTAVPVPISADEDFTIQTTLEKLAGSDTDSIELVWGSDFLHFCGFALAGTGHFRYFKLSDGKLVGNPKWQFSSHINKFNSVNTLTIRKRKDKIRLYINGGLVQEAPYEPFLKHYIGYRLNANLHLNVDNLVVFKDRYGSGAQAQNKPGKPIPADGEIVFEDHFVDNQNRWYVSNNDKMAAEIKNGQYLFEHKRQAGSWYSYRHFYIDETGDFSIEAKISKQKGSQDQFYALVFGRADSSYQYRFGVSPGGRFQYARKTKGAWSDLISWTASRYINKKNRPNILKVQKKKDTLYFFVNHHQVGHYAFEPFWGHQVGFEISGRMGIAVDYLRISQDYKIHRPDALVRKPAKVKEHIIFEDEFADNRNHWYQKDSEKVLSQVKGGRYIFEHRRDFGYWYTQMPLFINQQRDFSIETTISRVQGSPDAAYEFVWGRRDEDNYFSFQIALKGNYRVGGKKEGKWVDMIPWKPLPPVAPKHPPYRLIIKKAGDSLLFYVNDLLIDDIRFEPFWGTKVGFILDRRLRLEIDHIKIAQSAYARQPILEINADSHLRLVRALLFTKDGRSIVSGGGKTIRIWDVRSGKLQRILRGEMDQGAGGTIYAMALSPDERFLAVGGRMGPTRGYHALDLGRIRLYDFDTGEIRAVFKGHRGTVHALAFSSDGSRLISGGADNTARIIEIAGGKTLRVLKGHTDTILSVAFSPDDKRVVTAGEDKTLRFFNARTGALIRVMRQHTHKVYKAAFTPDGRYIVSGGFDHALRLWDGSTGDYVKLLARQETRVPDFALSKDGTKILTASSGVYGELGSNIFALPSGKHLAAFKELSNIAIACAFSPDGKIAAIAGGNENEIILWDPASTKTIRKITGWGKAVWGVGFSKDSRRIAWSSSLNTLEHTFQLVDPSGSFNFSLGPKVTDDKDFVRWLHTKNDTIVRTKGGQRHHTLQIMQKGSVVREITEDLNIMSYTLSPDGETVFTSGAGADITAYSVQTGKKIREYLGHIDEVWALAVSPDGRWLVSGSLDKTIKLWDVVSGRLLVSIFHDNDTQWVAWTPEGYYTASSKGDRYAGWRVNRGFDRRADYYTARQFRRYLYRPDIINAALRLGSSRKALAVAGLEKLTVADLIERAPVDIQIADIRVDRDNPAKLTVKLGRNTTTIPEKVTLYINGAQVLPRQARVLKGIKPGDVLHYQVNLKNPQNHIKILMENRWAETGDERSVENPYSQTDSRTSGKLYVAAVGICHYPHLAAGHQLQTPGLDARSFAKRFLPLKGRLYEQVVISTLTDDQKTGPVHTIAADQVEAFLSKHTAQAGPEDTTIIFLAGHGVSDDQGNYHFITADTLFGRGRQMAVPKQATSFDWKRLHNILDQTLGRRMIVVDTCQAGTVLKAGSTDLRRLIKDIHDVNAIIYSGTSRQQYAVETSQGGVFTHAILDGIDGRAQYQDNRLLFTALKNYVDRVVPQMNRKIVRHYLRGLTVEERKDVDMQAADIAQYPRAVVPKGLENFFIYQR